MANFSDKLSTISRCASSCRFSSRLLLAIILLAGLCLSLLIPFSHLGYWRVHAGHFYYGQNLPLMTTFDAYHYLQITSDLVKHEKRQHAGQPLVHFPAEVSLLARLTAVIHRVTQWPIEQVAFYLPPILASLMVVVYVLWGSALGGPLVALGAVVAGSSSFYWYSRTCLGRFDTDCLNPFFVYMIIAWVYLGMVESRPRRYLFFALALGFAYLFGLWWVQVPSLGFFIVLLAYGMGILVSSSWLEKTLQGFCLVAVLVVVVSVPLGLYHLFPRTWAEHLHNALNLFNLITKKRGVMFADVSQSISELQPPSWSNLGMVVGGSWLSLAASFAGLLGMARFQKRAAIFLTPGLMLSLGTLFARRFLIFWVPLYALGMGYFLGGIVYKNRCFRRFLPPVWRATVLILVTGVVLFPGISRSWSRQIGPAVTASDVRLAKAITERPGFHPVIWSWWDYGYFLHYITGEKTFIDGGSQSEERTFIAAFALSCQDSRLARNWMRFFSCHELQGLAVLRSRLGSTEKALRFLKTILAKPEAANQIIAAYGLRDPSWWKRYLFPNAQVGLFLNQSMIDKAYWWYYFGTWDPGRRAGIHPEVLPIEVGDLSALWERGLIKLDKHLIRVAEVVRVDGINRDDRIQAKQFSKGKNGNQKPIRGDGIGRVVETADVAVCKAGTDIAYVMDRQLFQSLTCQLLFGVSPPGGRYETISYRPWEGGVWRVE